MANNFKVIVYYEDTDFSGFVYHANYFKFIERARSHLITLLGIDQLQLRHDNMSFAVCALAAKFVKPTYFGDYLEVETDLVKIGGASILLSQRVLKQQECVFGAEVRLGLVSGGRAIRLPSHLKEKLLSWSDFK